MPPEVTGRNTLVEPQIPERVEKPGFSPVINQPADHDLAVRSLTSVTEESILRLVYSAKLHKLR